MNPLTLEPDLGNASVGKWDKRLLLAQTYNGLCFYFWNRKGFTAVTQLEAAKKGIITEQMVKAAKLEGISGENLRQKIASGEAVLPCNINHREIRPVAVGKGLSTKVNANVGTSDAYPDLTKELTKMEVAIRAGAHSIMDLSTGGDIDRVRKSIIATSPVMVGTVPIYQVMVDAQKTNRSLVEMTDDDIFAGIEKHCQDGADFITVHCGVTMDVINELRRKGLIT